jgi:hypothetical protein
LKEEIGNLITSLIQFQVAKFAAVINNCRLQG